MTGPEFAAAIPTPLAVAGLAAVVVSMPLRSLAEHGKCSEAWANGLLVVSFGCLVLAFLIAGCTP